MKKSIKYSIPIVENISRYIEQNRIVNISLGKNQEICILTRSEMPEKCAFPQSKGQPQTYKVIMLFDDYINQIEIVDVWNHHFVQPIDNQNILLVCARSHYNDITYHKNARVFNRHGEFIRDFVLGDGIQDLKVTNSNIIWTSYFDEGVFGNYEWNNPIGTNGLRSWDNYGNELYKYNNHGEHFISDCYALNIVDDDQVWFYFYTAFELAHKNKNDIQYYKTDISGSDGFAIYDKYVLFRGGYKQHNNYYLYEIRPNCIKLLNEIELLDQSGDALITNYFDCRSSKMLLTKGMELYILDLKDLVAAIV